MPRQLTCSLIGVYESLQCLVIKTEQLGWAISPATYHIISPSLYSAQTLSALCFSLPLRTERKRDRNKERKREKKKERTGWLDTECKGGSLDYVTSSGRVLDLFPLLLRDGEKRPFHYWGCHTQFGLTVSMRKASWIFNPHLPSPPHLLPTHGTLPTTTLTQSCAHYTTFKPPSTSPPSPIPPAADRRGDSLIRSSIVAVNSGFPEHLDRRVTAGSELPLSPWPRPCVCECVRFEVLLLLFIYLFICFHF